MPVHRSTIESYFRPAPVAQLASLDEGSQTLVVRCGELFCSNCAGLTKLSIDTSNDLFEMDPRVTKEELYHFRSKRGEWASTFDVVLRELVDKRLRGEGRKGRRPDSVLSLASLRVMNDTDTRKQRALSDAAKRLRAACSREVAALDYRMSMLFKAAPSREFDNPFSPAYLLDAIGMTSRTVYPEPHIWRAVMERVINDFMPAIGNIYIQLNRYLAERGVLPDIGASLRARSQLRPNDDRQLLSLYSRLLNEVDPSLQAWRTLDASAAEIVGFRLEPLSANPYLAVPASSCGHAAMDRAGFPRLDALMAFGSMAPLLETLDCWQRDDPLTVDAGRAVTGTNARQAPVNRIPWIHAAMARRIRDDSVRTTMDVIALLFDFIFREPSITPSIRMVFDALQLPILKAALADPAFFFERQHPARRLIDGLAEAAIGAEDDPRYDTALRELGAAIAAQIRKSFVFDMRVFEAACRDLEKFSAEMRPQASFAIQAHVDHALADEAQDGNRAEVRRVLSNKMAGLNIPFEVRAFVGTIWADCLTLHRQAEGADGASYIAAVKTLDDMLWSITAKDRSSQKTRLSKMIPQLVGNLRAGAALVQAAEDKMSAFLDVLYGLHIAAVKPGACNGIAAKAATSATPLLRLPNGASVNLHDFIADIVPGTWFCFHHGAMRVHARLIWISPLRTVYIFADGSAARVLTFTPEQLAWDVKNGNAALVTEPVPLYDRAVSVTLEFLARHKAKKDEAKQAAAGPTLPTAGRAAIA